MGQETDPIQIGDSNSLAARALDTLTNLMTGMNTSRDKRAQNEWIRSGRSGPQHYEIQYETDWLSAAVVDTIPDDMLRERRLYTGLKPDQSTAYQIAEDHFSIYEEVLTAMKWGRLYGGAGLLMLLDGTGEVWEPLDVRRVKKGALKYLRVIDRWNLIPTEFNVTEPLAPDWGKPEFYRAFAGPDPIHRSRILFFNGVKLPYRLEVEKHFWGGSILDRVDDAVQNAIATQNGIASLVHEAKVDVVQLKNLFTMLGSAEGTALMMTRLELMQLAKSQHNLVLMDTDEEWHQKTGAITPGMEGILNLFLTIASAAADVPVTRMIGTSSTGLSATGEGDLRNYYDSVASKRHWSPDPQFFQLDEVLLRHVFGARPEQFQFSWPSLWQESETEKAVNAESRSRADATYEEMGVVRRDHIAKRLQESGEYPIEDEWIEELSEVLPPTPTEFE